jgi:hypothetical protein
MHIENGLVKDGLNCFKLGTRVPLEEFKHNLREVINNIKNYGE